MKRQYEDFPRLLSSCHGQIERIFILFQPWGDWKKDQFPDYLLPLANALVCDGHVQVHFDILVQADFDIIEELQAGESDEKADEWFKKYYSEVYEMEAETDEGRKFQYRYIFPIIDFRRIKEKNPDGEGEDPHELSQWVQDPFLVMENRDGSTVLLESFYPWDDRYKESIYVSSYIAEMLSSQTAVTQKSMPFHLHGGNILVGKGFAIVGGDVLRKNFDYFEKKMSASHAGRFLPTLKALLGVQPILWFDGYDLDCKPQSNDEILFHLDLFLTLGGFSSKYNAELVFVGQLQYWNSGKWEPVMPNSNVPQSIRKSAAYLEKYANTMKNWGTPKFKPIGLPLLYDNGTIFSYNNCIVEISEEHNKRVLLPTYHSEALAQWTDPAELANAANFSDADNEVMGIFKKEDFTVEPIKMGFRTLASERGSLHCITQVLSRTRS